MDKYSVNSAVKISEEEPLSTSTLGIRTIIAILIFAAYVYCDKEDLSYHSFSVKNIAHMIEWNPLSLEELYN